MIFTREHLNLGQSSNGAWGMKQLRLLNVNHKKRGWQERAIGKDYDPAVIEQFIALKDKHLVDGKNVFDIKREKKLKKQMEKLKKRTGKTGDPEKRPTHRRRFKPKVSHIDDLMEQFDFITAGL